MPWFLVGDQMHSAPMLRKITAIEPAAVGLWTVAGSWSSDHLTDGFIPDDDLPWLFPDAPKLAQALVTAGAWKRVRNGHRFITSDVTHRIPSRQAVENDRKAAAERQRRSRGAKSSRRDSHVTNAVSHGAPSLDLNHEPPNPPQAGGCPRHARPRQGCDECAKGPPAARHPSARTVAQAVADATRQEAP